MLILGELKVKKYIYTYNNAYNDKEKKKKSQSFKIVKILRCVGVRIVQMFCSAWHWNALIEPATTVASFNLICSIF